MKNISKLFSRSFLLIAFLGLAYTPNADAQKGRTVAGVTFDSKMAVKGTNLQFNGAGLREKYTLDLYVAALYLDRPSMDASAIMSSNKTQAIKIVIISDKVTRDKFNDSVKEGFANSTTGKASQSEIDKFKDCFKDEFNKGDEINLIYVPGKGVAVTINGTYKGLVEGLEFKKALFSIWLGDKPASKKLKKGMLGQV
jgi:hypothetical protein